MGRLILEKDLVPDRIVSSTAERAKKTAAKVAKACGFPGEVERNPDLYHASRSDWINVLSGFSEPNPRVLAVGHNPGIEDFLGKLIGDSEPMPTAALAQVALPIEQWAQLCGETEGKLLGFWIPKELD